MTRDPVRPLLVGIALFGVLHHTDHVLRADHSGWPFQADTTPFTFSLLIYPVILIDYFVRKNPWIRVGLLSAGLSFLLLVHLTVETPVDLFQTWQSGISTSAENPGLPNLLGLATPALGLVANLILAMLSALLVAALVVALGQALTHSGNRQSPVGDCEVN